MAIVIETTRCLDHSEAVTLMHSEAVTLFISLTMAM
jgi:hypothetical protein